ncbi:MAG: multicopper oxidase domain-containing protein [Phycisphaerae bacterium]|nr:multicopper oxidase domain-containing protein [Gemmatimonadaceae bacterium]
MILPATALLGIVLNAQLVASLPRVPLPKPAVGVARAAVHQNTVAAGHLVGGKWRLELDVVESAWKPEGDTDPEVPILAFAERGRAPLVPGPLLRVRRGTTVSLSLRNRSDSTLVIGGLRPGARLKDDTVQLAAGATREIEFTLAIPGTYFYWGVFAGTSLDERLWKDSQLNGAIVVDTPGPAMRDHIILLSEWFLPYDENRPFEVVSLMNGKGWPHTGTIELKQNDSTRFRVINAIPLHHPLHLHGFYYRIESSGSEGKNTPVPLAKRHLSNTDLINPSSTVTLSFLPSTPGNWLFHCHFAFHADETVTLSGSPRDSAAAAQLAASHATHGAEAGKAVGHDMRGLVMGIKVWPEPGYKEASTADAREMRLLVQSQPNRLITGATAYGFVLQRGDSVPARDSVVLPGPVLELKRNQPVRIVVKNNLSEPTSIHWHGLEIESFPDGVPHWSGLGTNVYSQIAPNDTFVAAFTPPRSGTFPYHSHLNDRHQINSGMYGALIVTDKPRDLTHDHLIVVGGGGPELLKKNESPFALVNGRRSPAPLRLTVGEKHRLRVVTIHPDWRVSLTLQNDSSIARWRAVAKDGADLPTALATVRPAHIVMGPGQTNDFEFTPMVAGEWVMHVRSVETGWYIPLPVVVVPQKPAKK